MTTPPVATIRADVGVPITLPDGRTVDARMVTFHGLVDGRDHLAIALGNRARGSQAGRPRPTALVRLHSECLTGDVFGSERCDCGPQLREALGRVHAAGGYVLYLRQEGRGIGLYPKLDAYTLQDTGLDTFAANRALGFDDDARDYAVAAQMIAALGERRIRLLTNNPDKVSQLRHRGVLIEECLRTDVHVRTANTDYLVAKATHAAHVLRVPEHLAGTGSDAVGG